MPLLLVQPRTNVIKNTDLEGGFYNSLRVPFLIIRFTGLFPLSGLMQRTSQGSGLNWKLWYFIIYLVSVCLQIFQLVLIITDFMFVGCYADNMTEFFVASTILFFIIPTFHKIAKNWESDIKAIEEIEMSLPRVVNHRKPLIIVLIINLLLALVYHIFYWVFTLVHHNRCHTKMTLDYFLRMVSDYGPMYHILGIALLLKRLQNNFILSSLDAVIILISLHLNIRIKGFNNFLKQKVNQFQRLMTQVYRSKVCLTGLNLFHITRGTLLTIVANLMTYELVLLQI